MSRSPVWRHLQTAWTLGIGLALVAAGSAGQALAGSATPADATPVGGAFCDAVVAITTEQGPDVEFHEDMTEAEMAEAAEVVKTYAADVLTPLVSELEASAPGDLADQVAIVATFVEDASETGNFEETPEVTEAIAALEEYGAANCGWKQVTVTAVDCAFEAPATMEAGITAFTLVNEGTELHELVMFRVNDGVTLSVEGLLALPEEEVFANMTFVNYAFAAPGESGSTVAELTPGRYILLCFIPVGTTSETAEPAEDAHSHAEEGMVLEVTVQ